MRLAWEKNGETCIIKCTECIISFENIDNNQWEINQINIENLIIEEINRFTGKLKLLIYQGFLMNRMFQKYVIAQTKIILKKLK